MSMKLKTRIDKGNIKKLFEGIMNNVDKILNEEIKSHLELVKKTALTNKPWRDRTGTLRAGHVVRQSRDKRGRYTSAWELVADPYLNPQKGKKVTKDYGIILEYGNYTWFYPTVEALEPELYRNILKRIKKER